MRATTIGSPSLDVTDPWVARDAIERAWHRHASKGQADGVRGEVVDSWERSQVALTRDRSQAPLDDEDTTRSQWRESPVRVAVEHLRDDIDRIVTDGDFVVAVTGADGKILWTHGGRWMRTRAEEVHFVASGRWDEASMGTNALALSLRTLAPSEVFSAEHFSAAVHDWVCYSAPIRDPASGAFMGVLDLSTTWDRAHPLGLSTVNLLARQVGMLIPEGSVEVPAGLHLGTLGQARATRGGVPIQLPPRQLEIATVLTLHPEGLSLDGLHAAVYEDLRVSPSTCRAEVSYLRRALDGAVESRPYRLGLSVTADHLEVVDALRAGDVRRAVAAYGGPLLPLSEAPDIVEHRHFLDNLVRQAALDDPGPDAAFALGARMPHDRRLHEVAATRLTGDDPRHAIALARLSATS